MPATAPPGDARPELPYSARAATAVQVAVAAAATAAATLACWWLDARMSVAGLALVYLVVVVAAATLLNRAAGVAASLMCVSALNFFFVPPRFTFEVDGAEYWWTLAVLLGVSLGLNTLIAGMRTRQARAELGEARAAQLHALGEALAQCDGHAAMAGEAARWLADQLGFSCAVFVRADSGDELHCHPSVATAQFHPASAQWAIEHGRPLGRGCPDWPDLPLWCAPFSQRKAAGAVQLLLGRNDHPEADDLDHWQALVRQVGLSVERERAAEAARTAQEQRAVGGDTQHAARIAVPRPAHAAGGHHRQRQRAAVAGRRDGCGPARAPAGQPRKRSARHDADGRQHPADGAAVAAALAARDPMGIDRGAARQRRGAHAPALAGRRASNGACLRACRRSRPRPGWSRRSSPIWWTTRCATAGAQADVVIQAGRSRDGVFIAVRDHGPGLPDDDIARLFDRYERGGKAPRQGAPASGWRSARPSSQAHGGPDRGPALHARHRVPHRPSGAPIPAQPMDSATVLVVEDDASIAQFVAASLSASGLAARDGHDGGAGAWRKRATGNRHLVIVDLGLPDLDGVELIALLRARAATPILVLSARIAGVAEDRSAGRRRRRLPDQALRRRRTAGPGARHAAPRRRQPGACARRAGGWPRRWTATRTRCAWTARRCT